MNDFVENYLMEKGEGVLCYLSIYFYGFDIYD